MNFVIKNIFQKYNSTIWKQYEINNNIKLFHVLLQLNGKKLQAFINWNAKINYIIRNLIKRKKFSTRLKNYVYKIIALNDAFITKVKKNIIIICCDIITLWNINFRYY